MAEDGRDMLIRFVGPDGPFPGECLAAVSSADPLVAGFTPNFYSAAQDFDFAVGLEDPAQSKAGGPSSGGKAVLKAQTRGQGGKGATNQTMQIQLPDDKTSAGFDAFRGGGNPTYPADLQPFAFTKLFDIASLAIFNACATSQTLKSVTLVKRKAIGQRNPNAKATLVSYMRFLFTEVLITDLDWDEDDVVTEKVKFICRKVQVQYFPELHGGRLDITQPYQEWDLRNATPGGS